ncbi:MAG TPA: hypothetical protein VGO93_29950 [Candidatus Xenobia bacterium]|jgi:hypothetical protein
MEPTSDERSDLHEIQTIMDVLMHRLEPVDLIKLDEREIISYRLAEIFATARNLYTAVLPRFVDMPRADADEVFEAFGEVRMNLLHIKDLIDEFEEAFLMSLGTRLEEKEQEPDDQPESPIPKG